MFTKFDKNLTNYLANNKIYIDTSELKSFTDEDDSVINSLPDMTEIEHYADTECQSGHINQLSSELKDGGVLSPRSSFSSTSSASSASSSVSGVSEVSQPLGGETDGTQVSTKKIFNRNIHCVKEKIRRDRIKFSCNELRRLIPNLNGVKTDMASLLETSVLWIQLINSNIPEQLLINVQNKLENLKLLRSNKPFMVNPNCSHLSSPLKNLKIQPNNKNLNDSIDLNLKQEIYSPDPASHQNSSQSTLTTTPPLSDSTTFMESAGAVNMPSMCSHMSKHNHFMSKPSKWLYSNRNGTYQQDFDMQEPLRCCIPGNGNVFNDPDYYNNKMTKKTIDFNNNNNMNNNNNNNNNSMYLGQVPYNDQLDTYCNQNQQSIQIDQHDSVFLANSVPNGVYYQSQAPSSSSGLY